LERQSQMLRLTSYSPQSSSTWNFTLQIAASVFAPQLPPGSEKVPFATVAAS
jgi:hypothetical protein